MISESVVDAFGGDAKLAAGVVAELTKGHNFNLVQAQDRQNKVARLNQVEHGATPLGEMRMRIDADAYHYWGQRLGYECWKDPQFLHEYQRDNPAVKVKYRRLPMIQVDGFKKSRVSEKQETGVGSQESDAKDKRAAGLTAEERTALWKKPATKKEDAAV